MAPPPVTSDTNTINSPLTQEEIKETEEGDVIKEVNSSVDMVVCSRIKAKFKESGLQSRPEVMSALNSLLIAVVEAAGQTAKGNKRKTVRASDIPPVLAATALASDGLGIDEGARKAYTSACVDIAVRAQHRAKSNKRKFISEADV